MTQDTQPQPAQLVTMMSDALLNMLMRRNDLKNFITELRKMDGDLSTRILRAQQAPKGTYDQARLVAAGARLVSLREQLSQAQQLVSQIDEEIDSYTAI